MKPSNLLLVSALALSSAAWAGNYQVNPDKMPDWCQGFSGSGNVNGYQYSHMLKRAVLSSNDAEAFPNLSEKNLNLIARGRCEASKEAEVKPLLAKWIQNWVDALNISTEAEVIASFKPRLNADAWENQRTQQCEKALVVSKEDAEDAQYMTIFTRFGIGCYGNALEFATNESLTLMGKEFKYLDRRIEIPEIVRAAYLVRQLDALPFDRMNESATTIRYISARVDATRLSASKLEQELKDKHLNEFGRQNAREIAGYAKTVIRVWEERMSEIIGKSKRFKNQLEDIIHKAPDDAIKQWESDYQKNKVAIEAAYDFEQKYNNDDAAGLAKCSSQLREAWGSYIKSKFKAGKPVGDFRQEVSNDNVSRILVSRLALCDAYDKRYQMANNVLDMNTAQSSGPRLSALTAAISSFSQHLEKVSNKESFPLDMSIFENAPGNLMMPQSLWRTIFDRIANKTTFDNDTSTELQAATKMGNIGKEGKIGQISAIKPSTKKSEAGEKLMMIEFKTVSGLFPTICCCKSDFTHWYVEGNTLRAAERCAEGPPERKTIKLEPLAVPESMAKQMKVGWYAKFDVNIKPDPREGFPLEAFTDIDQKNLVMYYGILLK